MHFNPYLSGLGEMNVGELVPIVFHADGAQETTELEWKVEYDLSTRPRRASLARHVIAFANRDPDRAARVFAGHAFLLIGVEPGRLGSAPDLDAADIVQALDPFIGPDIGWHPVYVTYKQTRVLVLVVDPPQWGDPPHALARGSEHPETGKELKAGTVYVRRPGSTVPAGPHDVARLEDRERAQRPYLSLSIDWNLGLRGDYIGVQVRNGERGSAATLEEVGFTFSDPLELAPADDVAREAGEPDYARAFGECPLASGSLVLAPGESRSFRVPLAGPLPLFWDDESPVHPYVYFNGGRWLPGPSTRLFGLLSAHGWRPIDGAPPTLPILVAQYVFPPSHAGLRGTFDLRFADEG